MTSLEHKENLTKLTLEELQEIFERQNSILKNKKLIDHLPDKGKQLEEKLARVKKELNLRRSLLQIEGGLQKLSIECQQSEVLREKHVQHICSLEKSPSAERYKPFATLIKKDERNKTEKPTKMISLTESMTLLVDQATKLPVEKVIHPAEVKDEGEEQEQYSEIEDEISDADDDKSDKT